MIVASNVSNLVSTELLNVVIDVCNELLYELALWNAPHALALIVVTDDVVAYPNALICADELIVPATALPLIILLLKDALSFVYVELLTYEPVINPNALICADELIVPATALPLIILLLKDELSVVYVELLIYEPVINPNVLI